MPSQVSQQARSRSGAIGVGLSPHGPLRDQLRTRAMTRKTRSRCGAASNASIANAGTTRANWDESMPPLDVESSLWLVAQRPACSLQLCRPGLVQMQRYLARCAVPDSV